MCDDVWKKLIQPSVHWVPLVLSLGVKWLEHEAYYSLHVRNGWHFFSISTTCLHGIVLWHRDIFTFMFTGNCLIGLVLLMDSS